METVIHIIAAAINALGFSIVFKVRKELIPWTTLGGVLAWSVNLFVAYELGGIFLPYFIATVFAGLYSEIMARVLKAPAVIFLIISVIPSIPGKSLFFTMKYVVEGFQPMIRVYGNRTLIYAMAIACGISVIWALNILIRNTIGKKKQI